jgi:paraquat-inducible protein A
LENETLDAHASLESVACADCDLLQQLPALQPGSKAVCARCGRTLEKKSARSRDLPLALAIAAAIALIVANTLPLMELHVVGRSASTTIAGGAYEMWLQGQPLTAVLVAFCAVVAPALYVLFMLTLLIAARRPSVPHWAGEMLRWLGHLQVWSMLEVVMLGILVALTKIAELAAVEPGIGMFAFGATILLIPAIMTNFDKPALWRRIAWNTPETPHGSPLVDAPRSGPP